MKPIKINTNEIKPQIKVHIMESGESIEEMIRRCVANNEPIGAEAPMEYTEKAKGVYPEHDIRTDKQELALDAIDKFQKSEIAKAKAAEEANQKSETTEIIE